MDRQAAEQDMLSQLAQLQTQAGYYHAGIPNYEHLFGRDSAISALQMLHRDPAPARATLDILAQYAGTRQALWWEEYKGKILHEHYPGGFPEQWHDLVSEGDRLRQLAALIFWRFPYYGSVDAGAWYLILLHHYLAAYPDPIFARSRLKTARGIVGWLNQHATHARTHLVGFRRHYIFGLRNQSWKDNLTNVITPPVAMVEVQGYYYYALKLLSEVVDRYGGDPKWANELAAKSDLIRAEFKRYFVPDQGVLPMAVDGNGNAVRITVSNPGQLLFTGILDEPGQQAVVRALMGPDMLTPYGIRTESVRGPSFNIKSYQNGSVWPFDNWVIYQGLKKCGFHQQADIIKNALMKAYTDLGSFPEAYSVDEAGFIGHLPSACRIQAWSAGAMMNLLDDAPLL
jgi:glycogen debranching enzyme